MQSDADAVGAFAQQLGILPSEEAAFGWIAEVGLQSPLPPRWTSHTDESSGYVYYVDHDRQVSSWENPLVPFIRRVVEMGRDFRGRRPGGEFFEEQRGLLWQGHKRDLECWHGPFADDAGRQYFVNSTEGVSSWSDPRVDAQYIFELESGLLTSLEEVLSKEEESPRFGGGGGGGGRHWRTAEGADVLTLEGPGSSSSSRSSVKKQELMSKAQQTCKQEQRTLLRKMSTRASRMHELHQDDLEAQRLQVSQKVEARRKRREASLARIPQMPGSVEAPETSVPPPPPPGGGPKLPPVSKAEAAEVFRPPALPPSPTANGRPKMPADLRLARSEECLARDFGRMELRPGSP